jgi:hypothetical protein
MHLDASQQMSSMQTKGFLWTKKMHHPKIFQQHSQGYVTTLRQVTNTSSSGQKLNAFERAVLRICQPVILLV